ncbi:MULTISPECIES: hypothetical protein [unclassified Megasphaera]|jgi:hypothetical protein|uniref:hypothetical protein n=1 Tax=unclassified Megasphaera TaxID=2626256 RepID=UPI0003FD08AA|nr:MULTISPECIES: hypothetical protein [unclassified Megasphaera]DAE75938.1 MAG TPA: hypothetical protein [Caudoviricetes sp.]
MDIKMVDRTDEELREISMQRKKNGSYTQRELKAQRILWKRTGCPFVNCTSIWELDD